MISFENWKLFETQADDIIWKLEAVRDTSRCYHLETGSCSRHKQMISFGNWKLFETQADDIIWKLEAVRDTSR